MVRLASAGLMVLLPCLGSAAEPQPRLDADGRPLPAEARLRFQLAKVLNTASGLPKARWPQYHFSRDGKTVTRVGGDTVITWDAVSGKELDRVLPAKVLTDGVPGVPLVADHYPRELAARSPDGKAVVTYSNPTVQQMRFTLTLEVGGKKWPDTGLVRRMVGVLQLAFTPDGRYALAQLDQELLQIWDVTAEEGVGHAFNFATPGPSGYRQVPLMHPAPDSRRVALVESDPKTATPHKDELPRLRWHLGVYELETRRRTGGVAGAGVLTAVDWSPDAALIAGAGRGAGSDSGREAGFAFVATAGTAFLMHPVDLPNPATAAALAADGRTLAVGTGGEVHLYEVRTGQLRHAFRPNAGDVLGLRFHPTGRSLVSESADGAVFLWDVRGELAEYPEPGAAALDQLWTDLGAADAAKAFRAIRQVSAHPATTLPDLTKRVTGQKRPTAAEIAACVANLSSRLYAERQAAEKELKAMGRIAHPALKAALAADSSAERHARAGRLLATTLTPAAVRTTRLVEAVERAGTAEAKALLAAWAADAGPELAAEAEAALGRWRR